MQEYQVIRLSSKRFESVNHYYCIIIELRAKRNYSLDLKIPLAMRLARTAAMRVEQTVSVWDKCTNGTLYVRDIAVYFQKNVQFMSRRAYDLMSNI